MAYPIWLTPAGNLGIVPELEYYQLPLDAYDEAGGALSYQLISGSLPPGIQVVSNVAVSTGYLQGIPVSTAGADQNQTYSFTIRVQNVNDGSISDRTFQLTITNIAPPIIVPRNVNLGTYFDGDVVNMQLVAAEFIQGATLTWTLESGVIPPGLTLTPTGLLTGYIYPIPPVSSTVSNNIVLAGGFDAGQEYIIVSVGTTDFTLWGATANTVGLKFIATGIGSGTGTAAIQDPAWDNTPWDELGWQTPLGAISKQFNFTIEVFDGVNYDLSTYKMYVVPKSSLTADGSILTIDTYSVDGIKLTIDSGPRHLPIIVTKQSDFAPERQGGWFAQKIQAVDIDGDVLQYSIPQLSVGSFDAQTPTGNTYLKAVATTGNITIGTMSAYSPTVSTLQPGKLLQVLEPYTDPGTELTTLRWYNASVNNYTTVVLTGNTIVTASAGNYITQSITGANATISNVSSTTGTIQYGGALLGGTITVYGINVITANIGDYITQPSTGANAIITANVVNASTVTVIYNSGPFKINSANTVQINGANIVSRAFDSYSNIWSNVNSYPISTTITAIPTVIAANIGDIITQPSTGANAIVITAHGSIDSGGYANTQNPYTLTVRFNSGTFTAGVASGNLKVNGANVPAYPTAVTCVTSIAAQYNNSNTFLLNYTYANAYAYINGHSTYAYPTAITSVGVNVAGLPDTQGAGFDQGLFDQGTLQLPDTLSIDPNSGWITGFLPNQHANQITYPFTVDVYKRDYSYYISSEIYTLTILGSLNNYVTWLTPPNLGQIVNGSVSDLSISAFSSLGKSIFYQYTPGAGGDTGYVYQDGTSQPYVNLPQGLTLLPNGLISGRVSFEVFSLDGGMTTFDVTNAQFGILSAATTFDHTFSFSVDAVTFDQTASATQVFIIVVEELNLKPYEDLYLTAHMTAYQRQEFQNIVLDQTVFPSDLIFRNNDPWFGVANDIRSLFLSGLNPSTAAQYAAAVSTNHFGKRLLFGGVKTAVAREVGVYDVIDNTTDAIIGTYNVTTNLFVPLDFSLGYTVSSTIPNNTTVGQQHVKYEVVYVDLLQQNYPLPGENNPNTINLHGTITTPYYDSANVAYYIATPNSYSNMDDAIITNIGYYNKSALPDWMTSTQPDGTVPGFKHAVVLAYTQPGASATIAWRFQQRGYDLNELNFTVDRYLLDNIYSTNYDIAANAFITSTQTTFDRYPALNNAFNPIGTVDYAVNIPFNEINELGVATVIKNGGLDGITSFTSGQTLVFYQQEFKTGGDLSNIYNQGWSDSTAPWDSSDISPQGEWDFGGTTGWDSATYVPGYKEWIDSKITGTVTYYPRINQRIGVWTININSDEYVTLNPTLLPLSNAANISGYVLTVSGTVFGKIEPGMMIYGNALVGGNSAIKSNTYVIAQQTSSIKGNVQGGIGTYIISNNLSVSTTAIYQDMYYNDTVFVRQGYTHGGVNIYFDPIIKTGSAVPGWSEIPQQIQSPTEGTVSLTSTGQVIGVYKRGVGFTPNSLGSSLGYFASTVAPAGSRVSTLSTIFDAGGTLFYDYRDTYTVPEQGHGVIKFPHQNVFH